MKKITKRFFITALFIFIVLISKGQKLHITWPNGGETLHSSETYNIKWTYENIDNILIEYSIDDGLHWQTIIASFPTSALQFAWKVPQIVSDECKVRITNAAGGGTQDESDAVFSVPKPSLSLYYPNTVAKLAGSASYIQWDNSYVNWVKIEYSHNNGSHWQTIADNVNGKWGYYNWTIPDSFTSNGLIRVMDVSNNALADTTDIPFSILPAVPVNAIKYQGGDGDGYAMVSTIKDSIRLINPNTPVIWRPNSKQVIRWESNNIDNIKIDFSPDNGAKWLPIINSYPSSARSYVWTVTDTIVSKNCLLRIAAVGKSLSDTSDAAFEIPAPSIHVLHPNGGIFEAGSASYIQWEADIAKVKLELSVDGGNQWSIIGTVPRNWGYYNITIPDSVGDKFLVRVSDIAGSGLTDMSDAVFHTKKSASNALKFTGGSYDGSNMASSIADSLVLTSPKGGEIWNCNSEQFIRWESCNVENLKIEFSADNGLSYSTIMASVPASAGYYKVVMPFVTSNTCKIRISSLSNSLSDANDSVFKIPFPRLKLLYPSGGEKLQVGAAQYIHFDGAAFPRVRITFTANDGATWDTIVPSIPGTWGYYNWTIPDKVSDKVKVRIEDIDHPEFKDSTLVKFSIIPTITVNPGKYQGGNNDGYGLCTYNAASLILKHPNGGEVWEPGTSQVVDWAYLNIEGNIKIEYSSDNEKTWNTIAASVPLTDNAINWTTPSAESGMYYKIRITLDDGLYTDKSDNFFILGKPGGINITSLLPNTSKYCANSAANVSFTVSKTFNSGNIFVAQLSDSAGKFEGKIDSIGSVKSTSSGTISIKFPERAVSTKYRLRIVSSNPTYISADNGSDIEISPLPYVNLGNDTLICEGDTLELNGEFPGTTYLWNTGETTPLIKASNDGAYTLQNTNACGTVSQSIKVFVKPLPKVELGNDTLVCENTTMLLNAEFPDANYSWNNGSDKPSISVSQPGKYKVSVSNNCGSKEDSIIVSHKFLPKIDLGKDTMITSGTSIIIDAGADADTYLWSNGLTTRKITSNGEGLYKVFATNSCGTQSDDLYIGYRKDNRKDIYVPICAGDSLKVDGIYRKTAGIYYELKTYGPSLDTAFYYHISVNPSYSIVFDRKICSGSSYMLPDGTLVNSTGTYITPLQTYLGCDSIITTHLEVIEPVSVSIIGINQYRCDLSDIILNANVKNDSLITWQSSGSGEFGNIHDHNTIYKPSTNDSIAENVFVKVIAYSYYPCPVIMGTMNFSFNKDIPKNIYTSFCEGDSTALPNGQIKKTAGTYKTILTNTKGCDSTILTHVIVNNIYNIDLNVQICEGEAYTLPDGIVVNTPGVYESKLQSVFSCDSTIITHLSYNNSTTVVSASIFENEQYTLPDGSKVNQKGTYENALKSFLGCDSLIITNLSVIDTFITHIYASICEGKIYVLPGGDEVIEAGTYTDVIKSSLNSDSTVITELTVNKSYYINAYKSICEGDSALLPYGNYVNTEGNYLAELITLSGCDSVITTHVEVKNTPAAPHIYQKGIELVSDISEGIQWFDSKGVILDANGPVYEPQADDQYYAKVTFDGCISNSSNVITFDYTPPQEFDIRVYPNPAFGKFFIEIKNSIKSECKVSITNLFGQELYVETFNAVYFNQVEVDIPNLSPGMYMIKVDMGNNKGTRPLVIVK